MSATVSENNTRLTFTIDKNLKTKAEQQATKERRSLSNLLNVALEEYLNNHKEEN